MSVGELEETIEQLSVPRARGQLSQTQSNSRRGWKSTPCKMLERFVCLLCFSSCQVMCRVIYRFHRPCGPTLTCSAQPILFHDDASIQQVNFARRESNALITCCILIRVISTNLECRKNVIFCLSLIKFAYNVYALLSGWYKKAVVRRPWSTRSEEWHLKH